MDRGQAVRSPLDQLEAQLNLVLEHTGRLFANNARNHGQINNPSRLKQVIAGANNNFHDALDQLESELSLARAVMRRDLATYRSQRGARMQTEATTTAVPTETDNATAINLDDDVVMGESPIGDAKMSTPGEETGLPEGEPNGDSNSPLHLDIPGQDHQAAGHPGDENTGTYSNFDFESLFNDPSSAGPASRGSPKTLPAPSPPQPLAEVPAPDPPALAEDTRPPPTRTMTIPDDEPIKPASFNDSNDDFDFADLTNFGPTDTDMQDTDGISSLLPGLESYANSGGGNGGDSNPQSVPAHFNIFDAAGAGDFGSAPQQDGTGNAKQDGQQQQQQQPQQPDMGSRDDTFDDIMNFTEFDMGDFSGGGEGEGGESKFDADFFDL
ncbi:hypothetical protein E4T38_05920 [Aureobasidium subglaciale]|nr:hypothetical protein E4T38_05920 [Aureobasidium subglaciale]KAI5220543.1 hypothetical protein E4T40_05851 [Aureobasidium subglaciale]KAI5224197.1 hypothetical protein E4T41_05781 [Aureobasidium subglaciale]KAI5260784.1 hypothetical protein E4T46_05744 [Aureobasidium subglaciale]